MAYSESFNSLFTDDEPETEEQTWKLSVRKIFDEITSYRGTSSETPMQCFHRFKRWFGKLGDAVEQMSTAEEQDIFQPDDIYIDKIIIANKSACRQFRESCARTLFDVMNSSDCESEASVTSDESDFED